MLAEERFALILNLLAEKRTATVQELCEALNASESTIRRDLTELARQGRLNKVHGGATLPDGQFLADEPTMAAKEALAVVRAGTLPTPPYGAITEVYLTFMTDPGALKGTAPQGQASAPKERSYAEEIMFRAKPYIQIPQGVHGEYSVELTLRINETGGIEQMSVSKSSGKAEVDNAVLTGVIREGVIPPRPAGSEPLTMRLLFTLKNN